MFRSFPFKKTLAALLLTGFLGHAAAQSDFKIKPLPTTDKELPSWMKDSQRLARILDGDDISEIKNPKVIGRYETPIDGLFAVAVQATVIAKDNSSREDYFIFYTDKTSRYLVAGLLIDVEKNRNVGQIVEQYIRGQVAGSPARALNLLQLHAVQWNPSQEKDGVITIVIDIGPAEGRRSFLNIAALHQKMGKTGKVRPLRIIPVTNAKDELSTAAMSMALGFEHMKPGDGYNKLLEFADIGNKASWLQKDRLLKEAKLKEVLGIGAFKMEENTTQAVLAKVDRLPLIYINEKGTLKNIPVPTQQKEWETLLRK